MGGLGLGTIMSIAMGLISNRDKIVKIIHDIQQLWLEIKPMLEKVVPDLIEDAPPLAIDAQPTEEGSFSLKWLQQSLNKLEGSNLDTDGEYGPNTAKAISAFQKKHGLEVDGWAGPTTTAKIVELLSA